MSARLMIAVMAMAAVTVGKAEPIKALLLVQNHIGKALDMPISGIASSLSQSLTGEKFSVVDPADVFDPQANRQAGDGMLPESSAIRLAEGKADVLITASLKQLHVCNVGAPVLARRLEVTMTLQAKEIPSGRSLGGITETVASRQKTPEQFDANVAVFRDTVVQELCDRASESFLVKMGGVDLRPVPVPTVPVRLGCNVPGADLAVNGRSWGTAQGAGKFLEAWLTSGDHILKVSYPFMVPYQTTITVTSNATFAVNLCLTPEGQALTQSDIWFKTQVERIVKDGAIDDEVRLRLAKSYAKYFSSSYQRLSGMPQALSVDSTGGNFLLSPVMNRVPMPNR